MKRARRELVTIVPGIRLAGDDRNDQRRIGTPEAVAAAGADVLVVGRAVTAAADPARVPRRRVHAAVARRDRGLARAARRAQARPQLRPTARLAMLARRRATMALAIADARVHAEVSRRKSSLSQSCGLRGEPQVPHGGVRYGEPALAHAGAAPGRAREGGRRAPAARRGEGQAEDRLAVARGAVRASRPEATMPGRCSRS